MLITPDLDNPDTIENVGHLVSKGPEYTLTSNGELYYNAIVWPNSCLQELQEILKKRAEFKKQFDDSLKLIYELRNRVTRGEFK